jgi:hypothetical protein
MNITLINSSHTSENKEYIDINIGLGLGTVRVNSDLFVLYSDADRLLKSLKINLTISKDISYSQLKNVLDEHDVTNVASEQTVKDVINEYIKNKYKTTVENIKDEEFEKELITTAENECDVEEFEKNIYKLKEIIKYKIYVYTTLSRKYAKYKESKNVKDIDVRNMLLNYEIEFMSEIRAYNEYMSGEDKSCDNVKYLNSLISSFNSFYKNAVEIEESLKFSASKNISDSIFNLNGAVDFDEIEKIILIGEPVSFRIREEKFPFIGITNPSNKYNMSKKIKNINALAYNDNLIVNKIFNALMVPENNVLTVSFKFKSPSIYAVRLSNEAILYKLSTKFKYEHEFEYSTGIFNNHILYKIVYVKNESVCDIKHVCTNRDIDHNKLLETINKCNKGDLRLLFCEVIPNIVSDSYKIKLYGAKDLNVGKINDILSDIIPLYFNVIYEKTAFQPMKSNIIENNDKNFYVNYAGDDDFMTPRYNIYDGYDTITNLQEEYISVGGHFFLCCSSSLINNNTTGRLTYGSERKIIYDSTTDKFDDEAYLNNIYTVDLTSMKLHANNQSIDYRLFEHCTGYSFVQRGTYKEYYPLIDVDDSTKNIVVWEKSLLKNNFMIIGTRWFSKLSHLFHPNECIDYPSFDIKNKDVVDKNVIDNDNIFYFKDGSDTFHKADNEIYYGNNGTEILQINKCMFDGKEIDITNGLYTNVYVESSDGGSLRVKSKIRVRENERFYIKGFQIISVEKYEEYLAAVNRNDGSQMQKYIFKAIKEMTNETKEEVTVDGKTEIYYAETYVPLQGLHLCVIRKNASGNDEMKMIADSDMYDNTYLISSDGAGKELHIPFNMSYTDPNTGVVTSTKTIMDTNITVTYYLNNTDDIVFGKNHEYKAGNQRWFKKDELFPTGCLVDEGDFSTRQGNDVSQIDRTGRYEFTKDVVLPFATKRVKVNELFRTQLYLPTQTYSMAVEPIIEADGKMKVYPVMMNGLYYIPLDSTKYIYIKSKKINDDTDLRTYYSLGTYFDITLNYKEVNPLPGDPTQPDTFISIPLYKLKYIKYFNNNTEFTKLYKIFNGVIEHVFTAGTYEYGNDIYLRIIHPQIPEYASLLNIRGCFKLNSEKLKDSLHVNFFRSSSKRLIMDPIEITRGTSLLKWANSLERINIPVPYIFDSRSSLVIRNRVSFCIDAKVSYKSPTNMKQMLKLIKEHGNTSIAVLAKTQLDPKLIYYKMIDNESFGLGENEHIDIHGAGGSFYKVIPPDPTNPNKNIMKSRSILSPNGVLDDCLKDIESYFNIDDLNTILQQHSINSLINSQNNCAYDCFVQRYNEELHTNAQIENENEELLLNIRLKGKPRNKASLLTV